MALAPLRTAKTGEILPAARPATIIQTTGQAFYRGKQIKNICHTCAFEYCPNAILYARPDTPLSLSFVSQTAACEICGAKNKYVGGVGDPANYGGMLTAVAK